VMGSVDLGPRPTSCFAVEANSFEQMLPANQQTKAEFLRSSRHYTIKSD
jgi:hypothetical protein